MELLLLHGAIGSSAQLLPLAKVLGDVFKVSTLDFSGHGENVAQPGAFSIRLFAEDVLRWIKERQLESIDIFGYSMGGYVGLYLARHYPEKVNSVFTFATKFSWTPEIASREIKMLEPEKILAKLPHFAAALSKRHVTSDWKVVLKKTADMMVEMGANNPLTSTDFALIAQKVMVGIGDRDKMVGLDETVDVFTVLPNSSLLVLPATEHPIETIDVNALSLHIHNFYRLAALA